MNRLGALLVPAALLAACASTSLTPAAGTGFRREEDEQAFWSQAAKEQATIDASGAIEELPALETYLLEVAHRLEPAAAFEAIPFRIRVVKDFRLNAFSLPNGAVYLYSGILAQMDSEAELATLLGHEMTHATHRHAVREFRELKNATAIAAVTSAPLAGLTLPTGGLAATAAVTGYTRDLEREADVHGLALVAAAGYDVTDAPKLFRRLEAWRASEKLTEPYFFGSHPRLVERIETFDALLATTYAGRRGGIRNVEVFRERTSQLVLDNARLDLAAGRIDAAARGVDKHLAVVPNSAEGYAVRGELWRRQGAMPQAAADYQRALDLDPVLAEAHRGLGLTLLRLSDPAGGRSHLVRYLELSPGAVDRAFLQDEIRNAGKGGTP